MLEALLLLVQRKFLLEDARTINRHNGVNNFQLNIKY